MSTINAENLSRTRATLEAHGQGHLLAFWAELDDERRASLLGEIEQINFAGLGELVEQVRSEKPFPLPADIQPAPFYPAQPGIDLVGKYADAVKRGVSLIRKNKVAAF